MTGSMDKAHIDEMYKLSKIESAIDFTYSAVESKIDCVYSVLSSEIENAESIIRSEVEQAESILTSEIEQAESSLRWEISETESIIESKLDHTQQYLEGFSFAESVSDSLARSVVLWHHSIIESKLDNVGSLCESKLDHLALMVSELSAVDISEIESRVEHIQSDVDALKEDVSILQSVSESKLDNIALMVDMLSAIDISEIESRVTHMQSDIEAVKSEVRHTKSDVEATKSEVRHIKGQQDTGYTKSVASSEALQIVDSIVDDIQSHIHAAGFDVSAIESKLDGQISSHLIHIHSDVDTAKSDIQALLTDVSIVQWTLDGQIHDSLSLIESKVDGPVLSHLIHVHSDVDALKVDVSIVQSIVTLQNPSLVLSEVESKLDGPIISHLDTTSSRIQHVKSDVEILLGRTISISESISLVESKIEGPVSVYLVSIKNDTAAIPDMQSDIHAAGSRIQHVKSDVEDIKSHVDDMVSHIHAIHTDTINLTTNITDSVASSEALRVIDSNLDAIMDLQEAGGTLKLTGAEQDLYVNAAPGGNYILDRVMIDLTHMMPSAATTYDSVIVREYVRIKSGGAYRLVYSELFVGSQILPMQIWPRDADGALYMPNRYGQHISIQQTGNAIAGSFITVDYEYFTYS